MAQYTILSSTGTDTLTLTDGTDTFRVQVRNDDLCFDVELTPGGFAGEEDVDWSNISLSTVSSGVADFRIGVRNAVWVIDQALNSSPGFSGTEDVDFSNIEQHSL